MLVERDESLCRVSDVLFNVTYEITNKTRDEDWDPIEARRDLFGLLRMIKRNARAERRGKKPENIIQCITLKVGEDEEYDIRITPIMSERERRELALEALNQGDVEQAKRLLSLD
jgi:hypothetical protein